MSSICNQYVVIDDYSSGNEAVILLSVNVTALLMIDLQNNTYVIRLNFPSSMHPKLREASISSSERFCEIMKDQKSTIENVDCYNPCMTQKLLQCETVDDFAKQMLLLIERLDTHNYLRQKCNNRMNDSDSYSDLSLTYYKSLLRDIDESGWNSIVSISNSLQQITVSVNDPSNRSHDVVIELPSSYPQGHPMCKLAIPKERDFVWKEQNTFRDILTEIGSVLSGFNDVWNVLEDIDKHCIVMDPSTPTFHHAYRRIYLRMII